MALDHCVTTLSHKPRIAIVSPFLDRSFGTERFVVEWVSRLADTFELHVYSQQIKDVDLNKVVWHRIPKLPGPHIFNFAWWFLANRLWRFGDRFFRRVRPDLVFSPGVNCLDADVMSVHIVFAEYAQKNKDGLSFARNPISSWPRLLHRKLYYQLIILLEKRIYTKRRTKLALTAKKTFEQLNRWYQLRSFCPVLYTGIEHHRFSPERRVKLRETARKALGLEPASFALLLIGNDWRNKGLPALCEALSLLSDLPVHLLVVSRENSRGAEKLLDDSLLKSRVHFLPTRADVEFYYSAADAYAGPSLEDTFALPPAEAMACGLPVIVSAEMEVVRGVSIAVNFAVGVTAVTPAVCQEMTASVAIARPLPTIPLPNAVSVST